MTVQPRKLSKQNERTKSHFKKAFISLINERGFSHVSITDIVNKAQYNRTTFYLHYMDKQHLTEELQIEMFDAIKRTSMDRYVKGEIVNIEKMGPRSFELMHFIYENQDFFNLYLQKDTIPGIHQDLPRAIYEILDENFVLYAKKHSTINSSAHKLYMAHGTAGLILEWIRKGYTTSADAMSLQLIEILQSFAKGFTIVNITK
ncbi:TetR/AcrR family transcriptional regulator [Alkalihalobacterium alkalinitrilicum]|uniref:TetR/AcrR family transcriptional regulator n=1 Tax=Alkalihalobacterium alkalinitrilicum TaxID=427920 RepID=UPI000995B1D9|nr:TetR/AcrR family transcriptional regulator [Alkalihalobacterium alkalinitrilicum]